MEKYEALWAYQVEDMKADAIALAIKRSPTRQKLEKARDFILDRQKQYKQIEEDIGAMVELVRKSTSIPCAVGFGISTPEQAAKMAGLSDGAIVGSAIVRLIHESGPDAPNAVRRYVSSMTRGLGRE